MLHRATSILRAAAVFFLWPIALTAAGAELVKSLDSQVETMSRELMDTRHLSAASGALVVETTPTGALKKDDIIIAVNGIPIADADALAVLVAKLENGTRARVEIVRGGQLATIIYEVAGVHGATVLKPAPSIKRRTRRGYGSRPPSSVAPESLDAKKYSIVKTYYATDRNLIAEEKSSATYGTDRSDTVTYGISYVTIPSDHQRGQIEAPSILRLEFSEDPDKHVTVAANEVLDKDQFFKTVRNLSASDPSKTALVFVHGYNVTFDDAAKRTAQMTADLKFRGIPFFFSWPSQESYFGYHADEQTIDWAKTDLQSFLADLLERSQASQVYLIAHSMGSRALTAALKDLFLKNPGARSKIKEIVLAAPDIDAEVFERDIAPTLAGGENAITLYELSKDWALRASKTFHGVQRLGDSFKTVTLVRGMNAIDATAVDTGLLGHSYYGELSILSDIVSIIAGVADPNKRERLKLQTTEKGPYWVMSASP